MLAEALLVGLAASIGGLIGGIGIAAGLQALLNGPWEANLPDGPLVIAPSTVIASLVVGVAVTVLAAWLPSLRASRIAPVAAMSSSEQPATQKSLLVRNIIGLLFAVGGALGLVGGAAAESVNLVGLGSGALMIGVFVLTPLLSRPVIALFAPVLRRLFGTPGKLARENAVRNPRRTAATASALTIGVTLITTLSVVGASVSKAADRAFASDIKADYAVAMDNWSMLAPEVAGQIARTAGVTATSVVRDVPVQAVADGDTSWLTSVDAATFDRLVDVKVTAGAADALQQGKLLASKDYAERNHLTVGSTLDITYPDGTRGSLAVGALAERNSEIGGLIAPDKVVGPHAAAGSGLKKVLVKGADGATPALKQALRDATGGNPLIGIKGEKDIKAENNRAINGVLNVMYGLLGMSVIVAILGVVNTMAMSVFERRREIGMLRAIGLDRRGVGRMVRLESLMIALFGGVVGVLLGIVTAWAAVRTIAGSLKSITLVVPPVQIGFFLVAAAVIGLLAAVWPALRAARLDILGAIKSE